MSRALTLCVLFLGVAACAGGAGAPACATDDHCLAGSFCAAGGRCVALPAGFAVALDPPAAAVTAGKVIRFRALGPGGVSWAVREGKSGGVVEPDGTYHAPEVPGAYHVVATSTADPGKSAEATATVAPVPRAPTIVAAAVVTAGQTGLSASVASPQAGMALRWTVAGGGTLISAATGVSIVYSAGAGTPVQLTCRATNAAGDFAEARMTVAVAPVPVKPQITAASPVRSNAASSASVPARPGMRYQWSLSSGTITSAGGTAGTTSGAVNSIAYRAGLPGTLIIKCRELNAAGTQSADGTANVMVLAATAAVVSAASIAEPALHTATVLRDGSVLVVGGADEGAVPQETAALFLPSAPLFSQTFALRVPRAAHTATLLGDGRVLLAGGYGWDPSGGASVLASVELYEPERRAFVSAGRMQVPRAGHTATLLPDGTVLLAGGVGPGGRMLDSIERFDPAAGTFRAAGRLHVPRAGHGATLLPSGSVLFESGKDAEVFEP